MKTRIKIFIYTILLGFISFLLSIIFSILLFGNINLKTGSEFISTLVIVNSLIFAIILQINKSPFGDLINKSLLEYKDFYLYIPMYFFLFLPLSYIIICMTGTTFIIFIFSLIIISLVEAIKKLGFK